MHLGSKTGPREGSIEFGPNGLDGFKTIQVVYNPKANIKINDFLHFEMYNRFFVINLKVLTNFDSTPKVLK